MSATILGFGFDSYGYSAYGGGVPEGVAYPSILSAQAIADRIARVTLSAEPQHVGAFASGDALNPRTWAFQRLDTGERVPALTVKPVDAYLVWDVFFQAKFGPYAVSHDLQAFGLLDAAGALFAAPRRVTFSGCMAPTPAKAVAVASDLQHVDGSGLQVGSSGDYAEHSGVDLLRKLILRRLTTRPGEFFHLVRYGVGIAVKEPLPTAELVRLKADIERQIQQEPDVAAAAATLRIRSSGQLDIFVRATYLGTKVDLNLAIPPLAGG